MKGCFIFAPLAAALFCTTSARAELSEETLAQRCLTSLINTWQDHAYMQKVLTESRVVPESVVVERYDENVGQQHIDREARSSSAQKHYAALPAGKR